MLVGIMKSAGFFAIAAAAALLASSCSDAAQSVESASAQSPATTTTTAASTTTTTAAPTSMTEPAPAIELIETRPEILNLALPTFAGDDFDPNSVAGMNVILWFWGAH